MKFFGAEKFRVHFLDQLVFSRLQFPTITVDPEIPTSWLKFRVDLLLEEQQSVNLGNL